MPSAEKYIFLHDPSVAPIETPENEGFAEALALFTTLQQGGVPIEVVNTTQLDERVLQDRYLHAVAASVVKKYRIRQVFGSRRRSGWLFGKGVPALLVYKEWSQYPEDVYPHNNAGRIVTIKDFLESTINK